MNAAVRSEHGRTQEKEEEPQGGMKLGNNFNKRKWAQLMFGKTVSLNMGVYTTLLPLDVEEPIPVHKLPRLLDTNSKSIAVSQAIARIKRHQAGKMVRPQSHHHKLERKHPVARWPPRRRDMQNRGYHRSPMAPHPLQRPRAKLFHGISSPCI